MKQFDAQCRSCRHVFHACGPCGGFDLDKGRPCDCEGSWYEETKQISGFCYVLTGTPRSVERDSHAACPGRDYPYPCECDCHDR